MRIIYQDYFFLISLLKQWFENEWESEKIDNIKQKWNINNWYPNDYWREK